MHVRWAIPLPDHRGAWAVRRCPRQLLRAWRHRAADSSADLGANCCTDRCANCCTDRCAFKLCSHRASEPTAIKFANGNANPAPDFHDANRCSVLEPVQLADNQCSRR